MQTIPEIVNELKTRRDWGSVQEVENKFDDILKVFEEYQLDEYIRHKKSDEYKHREIIEKINECQSKHLESAFLEPNVPTANEVRKAYSNCINLVEEVLK